MSLTLTEKQFVFKTQLPIVLLTGFKASDVRELRDCLKKVPDSSIYFHTHHFLQQHQFLVQEPPNDFAYWATYVLNENKIGERLAAVDVVKFYSLGDLRKAVLEAIEPLIAEGAQYRRAPRDQEFHFMRSMLFCIPTQYEASNLKQFAECLKKVSINSLYYHLFEARLHTAQRGNDFSRWIAAQGEEELARRIERLDPYSNTMESSRAEIIRLIEERVSS